MALPWRPHTLTAAVLASLKPCYSFCVEQNCFGWRKRDFLASYFQTVCSVPSALPRSVLSRRDNNRACLPRGLGLDCPLSSAPSKLPSGRVDVVDSAASLTSVCELSRQRPAALPVPKGAMAWGERVSNSLDDRPSSQFFTQRVGSSFLPRSFGNMLLDAVSKQCATKTSKCVWL